MCKCAWNRIPASQPYHSFWVRIRVRAQNMSTWTSVKIAVAIEMNILLFRWLIHAVRTHFFISFSRISFGLFVSCHRKGNRKKTPKLWHRKLIFDRESVRLFHEYDVGNRWEYISNVFQSAVQFRSMETGHFSFSSFLFSFDPPNAWHKTDIFVRRRRRRDGWWARCNQAFVAVISFNVSLSTRPKQCTRQ